MKLFTPRLAVFVAWLLVGLSTSASMSRAAGTPYEITAMLPMTGAGAFQGRAQATALESYAAYVNRTGGIRGRELHFVIVDTQTSPQISVQIMNDVVARKAAVVIGPAFAAECAAVMAIVKNGPVDYCTSPGVHPDTGSYEFSAGISTVDLISAMTHYLRDRGVRRLALLTSTDASGQDGERGVTLRSRSLRTKTSCSSIATDAKIVGTKNMVLYFLATRGLKKIEGKEFTLRQQKNSQDSVEITDAGQVPINYRELELRVPGPYLASGPCLTSRGHIQGLNKLHPRRQTKQRRSQGSNKPP